MTNNSQGLSFRDLQPHQLFIGEETKLLQTDVVVVDTDESRSRVKKILHRRWMLEVIETMTSERLCVAR